MKKNILALAILSGTIASANQFNIIIDKNKSEYKIEESYTDSISYSEWTTVSIDNCIEKDTEGNKTSDHYYNTIFSQEQICQENQERIKTTTRNYSSGREDVFTDKEIKQNPIEQSNNATGTHTENSCKGILDNNFSIGTGMYYIQTNSEPFEVRCDMVTDGGGWTLLQSGTVNSDTQYSEFYEYHKRGTTGYEQMDYINEEKFYMLDYENRHTIKFTEFKVRHEGNTGVYQNHVVMDSEATTSASANYLANIGIRSYRVSNTSNPLGNDTYELNDCEFINSGTGHISCESNGVVKWETQNPWYQKHKVAKFGVSEANPDHRNTFGIHTCIRFLYEDGTSHESCREELISSELFDSGCVGDHHWKTHLTAPTCNYRSNPNNYYKWNEWVR